MNITDNLIRIKTAKTDIINSLKNKGVEIPDNTLINEIPTIIDNAEIGGGGDTPSVPTELVQKYDGATVFRINVPTDNYEFAINLCNDATEATYDVDWGDGSLESGLTTDEQHHIYSKKGVYDVNVYNLSREITLGGSYSSSISSSSDIYYLFNNTNNDYWLGNRYVENKDNTTVTNILVGDKITSIGNSAFYNCSSLQSVVIPEGVTSIGNSAFNGCSSLQSVVIPEGVTSIGNSAFQGCSSLTYAELPSTLTSIGSSNFNGGYSNALYLKYIISRALTAPTIQSTTFQYCGIDGILYIPKDADITTYQSSYWKTNLLDKGWTIEYIEDMPEKVATTFEFTTVNDKLIKISSMGKGNLISEEKIDNKYIYNFDDVIYLSVNTLPTSLITTMKFIGGVELGDSCCKGWTTLQSVVIPEGVTSIGNNAFEQCKLLSTITCLNPIAPTLNGSTVFYQVGSAVPSGTPKILRIPQGSSGYEETTSEWYKQLISKGYTIEYIVPNTLNYTSYSGDVVTPYIQSFEGKNEIVSNVYENGIGTITFKEGLTEIYEGMYNKDIVSGLTTIEIPNGITTIGDYSFRRQNLTTLNVPNSVTYIGDSAFNSCASLTEITLGNSVETIGQWAFSGCTKIATITCMAMVAPTLNQSFLIVGSNVSGDKILRVPEGAEGYDTWLSQLNGFTIEYIN